MNDAKIDWAGLGRGAADVTVAGRCRFRASGRARGSRKGGGRCVGSADERGGGRGVDVGGARSTSCFDERRGGVRLGIGGRAEQWTGEGRGGVVESERKWVGEAIVYGAPIATHGSSDQGTMRQARRASSARRR